MKPNLTKLDNMTKILLIVLVVAVSYFISFLILRAFFPQPSSMMGMMNEMTTGGTRTTINLISLIIALLIGITLSLHFFKTNKKDEKFDVIKKVLSSDERAILDEIKKAGEITQDSLRIRLNWSKAKISTILTNLDKRDLIQRERIGKTYKVWLQK